MTTANDLAAATHRTPRARPRTGRALVLVAAALAVVVTTLIAVAPAPPALVVSAVAALALVAVAAAIVRRPEREHAPPEPAAAASAADPVAELLADERATPTNPTSPGRDAAEPAVTEVEHLYSEVARSLRSAQRPRVKITASLVDIDGQGKTTGTAWAATIRRGGDDAEVTMPLVSLTTVERAEIKHADVDPSTFTATIGGTGGDAVGPRPRAVFATGDPFAAFRRAGAERRDEA